MQIRIVRNNMAKQDLNRNQQKIVKRYYDNLDTIVANKLQEQVSDLYLADSEKKSARLWKSVKQQLAKTPADPARVQRVIESQDVQALARLVNELVSGKGVLKSK